MLIVAFICFAALLVGWFMAPNSAPSEKAPTAKLLEVPAVS